MSVTVSPPVRLFALVGILGATALGAFFFLVARPGDAGDSTLAAPVAEAKPKTQRAARPKTTVHPPAAARPRAQRATVQTKTGFPAKIDRALRRNRMVVVAVYMPGSSVDRVVLAEARSGARKARAAYVPVSALNERAALQLVSQTGVLSAPAVLVVRPPGVVSATLGVTDRDTVAQAVVVARR